MTREQVREMIEAAENMPRHLIGWYQNEPAPYEHEVYMSIEDEDNETVCLCSEPRFAKHIANCDPKNIIQLCKIALGEERIEDKP